MEQVKKGEKILAIILRADESKNDVTFVTPTEFPLQVGVHNKEGNIVLKQHKHKPFKNLDIDCQEVFYIESGKASIDIYDEDDHLFETKVLNTGDTIVLNSGHGVKFLEKTKMIEVKQGPYRGSDKEKIFI